MSDPSPHVPVRGSRLSSNDTKAAQVSPEEGTTRSGQASPRSESRSPVALAGLGLAAIGTAVGLWQLYLVVFPMLGRPIAELAIEYQHAPSFWVNVDRVLNGVRLAPRADQPELRVKYSPCPASFGCWFLNVDGSGNVSLFPEQALDQQGGTWDVTTGPTETIVYIVVPASNAKDKIKNLGTALRSRLQDSPSLAAETIIEWNSSLPGGWVQQSTAGGSRGQPARAAQGTNDWIRAIEDALIACTGCAYSGATFRVVD